MQDELWLDSLEKLYQRLLKTLHSLPLEPKDMAIKEASSTESSRTSWFKVLTITISFEFFFSLKGELGGVYVMLIKCCLFFSFLFFFYGTNWKWIVKKNEILKYIYIYIGNLYNISLYLFEHFFSSSEILSLILLNKGLVNKSNPFLCIFKS